MSALTSIIVIALVLVCWLTQAMNASFAQFYLLGLHGSNNADPMGRASDLAGMVALAPMFGPVTPMELSPLGGLSATVDFAIKVLTVCLGGLLWAAFIYGVWRTVRLALSRDSPMSARLSISVLTCVLILYLMFVVAILGACGAMDFSTETRCDPLTSRILTYALAPAFGPATIVLKAFEDPLNILILTICPVLVIQAIVNCLFWATLIYYGSRAIHSRRYR